MGSQNPQMREMKNGGQFWLFGSCPNGDLPNWRPNFGRRPVSPPPPPVPGREMTLPRPTLVKMSKAKGKEEPKKAPLFGRPSNNVKCVPPRWRARRCFRFSP
jgi:hypothetical protein